MDEKTKELKRYTRELLRDHQALEQSLKEAEAVAEARAEEVARLQVEAKALEEKAQSSETTPVTSQPYLFGELCRTRDRAYAAEVEARRLKIMLEMAKELKSVDIARTKAVASRDLFAAMAALRKRQQRAARTFRKNNYDESENDFYELLEEEQETEEQRRRRIQEDETFARREREQLLEELEAAAFEVSEQFKRKPRPLSNADGSARRFVAALEMVASHRASRARRFEPYAGFLLQAAAATARLGLPKKAEDAVLVCVAKAKEAKIPHWMKRIGWGVGRAALLELLNRGVANVAFRAISLDAHEDEHNAESSVVDGSLSFEHLERLILFSSLNKNKTLISAAGPAVATFRDGALFLDTECARRVVRALYDVENSIKVLFAFSHLNEKSKRFLDDDKRSLGLSTTPSQRLQSFFDGAVNFVACGGNERSTYDYYGGGDTSRFLSGDDDDLDDFGRGDKALPQQQQQHQDLAEDHKEEPLHKTTEEDGPSKIDVFDVAPGPTMLAALRRRGAKSATTRALDLEPWRKAAIEPPRLWSKKSRGCFERRVKLREGPVPHVVLFQWQSPSQKLKWSLVSERGGTASSRKHKKAERTTSRATAIPEESAVASGERNNFLLNHDDDANSDDSLGVGGNEQSDEFRKKRWGGDLAIPDDDNNSDEVASVAVASAASVATRNDSLAFRAPETWSPAELVPGADKTLGPVRESWSLVPPGARVSLRCDLVAGRPVVRSRSARFRLAAIRADEFFGEAGHFRDVARLADAVAWHIAKDHAAFPPVDAADFCAKKQLRLSPRDLLEAHLRVDALNAAAFMNSFHSRRLLPPPPLDDKGDRDANATVLHGPSSFSAFLY